MPKKGKVLVALTPGLLEQVDLIAFVEHRNRSDLIREALRLYIHSFRVKQKEIAIEPKELNHEEGIRV